MNADADRGVTRQRRAVLVLFFANGATFSSWLPRVPEVRDRLDLSLGSLGLVLVSTGAGGLVSSVAAGVLVDRLGSRRTAVAATTVLGAGLVSIGLAPTALTLAASLVLLSAVDAMADIAMNVQAADVQRHTERSVMQRFHAGWSVGTVAGAASGAVAAGAGVGLAAQLAVTGAVLAAAALTVAGHLSTDVDHTPEPATDLRRMPVVALLAALAAVVAVVEGAPGEWAAVFVSDVYDVSDGVAALGYVAVAGGMVAGRLCGDRVTDRLGARRLFHVALTAFALGLGVILLSPATWIAVVGFAGTGLGASVLFPALYLQAATTPGVPSALGLGVMTSGARIGFLLSPAAIGATSDATSLRVGFGVVLGAALLASVLLGHRLRVRWGPDR